MRAVVAAWVALSVAGVLVIVLADAGPRLFSLSEEHGPSATETVGVLLLTAGWLLLVLEIWRRRERLTRYSRRGRFHVGVFALGVGLGLLTASVLGDYDWWWIVGVALLAVVQVAAFVTVARPRG